MSHVSVFDILQNEIYIWKMVYPSLEINQSVTLFYYPEYASHPHWNILYPGLTLEYSNEEVEVARRIFREKQCTGHFYSKNRIPGKEVISSDEFFIRTKSKEVQPVELNSCRAERTDNLEVFSEVVSECFGLTGGGKSQFAHKMAIIREKTESEFYLYFHKANLVGAWSTFQSSDQFNFIMNMGILGQYRGQGLAKMMADSAQTLSKRDLITHSNSGLLKKFVLPKLGYQSLGEMFVYEI